jgi:hypothetical protein
MDAESVVSLSGGRLEEPDILAINFVFICCDLRGMDTITEAVLLDRTDIEVEKSSADEQ